MKAFLFCLACSPLAAQQIPFSDILRTALEDLRVVQNRDNLSQVRQLKFQVPLIRRAEARIGFNGSTLGDTIYGSIRNEDFYGVVVGPNSFRERRKQAAFHAATIAQYETERSVLLAAAVSERYQTYTQWYFARKLRVEQEKLAELLQKEVSLWQERLMRGMEIKISDLLQTERDQYNLLLQIQENGNTERLNRAKLGQYDAAFGTRLPDTSEIITPAVLEKQLLLLKNAPLETPSVALRDAQWRTAQAEYAVEHAQNRQIFNFLQVGYDNPVLPLTRPNRRRTFNNFSLRVAVEVPIPGNNNPRRAKAALDLLQADNNRHLTRLVYERNAALQVVEVENLMAAQRLCVQQMENSFTRRLLNDAALQSGMTAEEWMAAQILLQRRVIQCLDVQKQTVLAYLRLIETKGWMAREPVQNFFRIE